MSRTQFPLFQLDAFTNRRFAGNPAAVIPMDEYPSDPTLQAIAAENNLAETAFLVPQGSDYRLRWFTPTVEVPLCGHATLASSAVVMERLEPGRTEVIFHTASGALSVRRAALGYVMNFPARPAVRAAAPAGLEAALGIAPREVWSDKSNYLILLGSAKEVRDLTPDMAIMMRIEGDGVIVTAEGDAGYDFVSRYFAPGVGIPEDPVTGSTHCALTPFWAPRLDKHELHAYQASARGGELTCRLLGERVELEGSCVFYLEGQMQI
jgi:PhzF family phenazine biosynthesis protein